MMGSDPAGGDMTLVHTTSATLVPLVPILKLGDGYKFPAKMGSGPNGATHASPGQRPGSITVKKMCSEGAPHIPCHPN